ncbi:molybdopterin-dependent oxidoreductase [Paraoerskovia marina]|uniref:Oxidoreductase molybdopterin binding domain-containing protein n=1 Tax=Paraoerskovia marina TaxID=545619 RepID=A0A1H1PG98_9CELL|nr:molybdopterin-dependent oxidoreductase [Paraoerskovia marina]SDS10311.1 Oxidoreductase molybdopterin binding domain-containing protein [Paraoerskovia marina]
MAKVEDETRRSRLPRLPRTEDFASAIHDPRVVARVGVLLGSAFLLVFLTGLYSHVHQNPVAWFPLGPDPAWLYRVTQGIHVGAGIACVPLLLAKLYAAYPALFEQPPVRGPLHALERLSVAVLVATATFQLVTGVLNTFQWYPWSFGFVGVHYATSWVVIGSLLIHVGVKLPVIVPALRARIKDGEIVDPEIADESPLPRTHISDGDLMSIPDGDLHPAEDRSTTEATATRRGFLTAVAVTTLGAVALTVGQTVRPLAPLSVLAPRDPRVGSQGVPVNKTAASAQVTSDVVGPAWRLELEGPDGVVQLSRDDLLAMDQHTADLPIACVEGWSAMATWQGVRVRDLVERAGGRVGDGGHDVSVASLQVGGAYSRSVLQASYVASDDTLLALRLNGQDLNLDHGYPARIIAPNRPGVLQTKWVNRLAVVEPVIA